ncbi:acyl-CoA dehydrogenase family protein [Niveispirillum sp.]|uniref:acyl-CoA dehydrogenase family protein n=1 Tax=Niveispirillum sp. TaxID=1917217 RepID=UPI001B64FD83|nr:acyl-CoA dehydrogenase family protein [Niveispirillum sp.]MBP7340435.1 acyl-CoA dehydrogenase family protein [Niveispirillum sp.]
MNIELDLKDQAWAAAAVETVRRIATDFREEIRACERNGRFPAEAFAEMGQQGLIGVITPVEFGGYGGDAPEYCLTTEAMARYNLVSSQIQIQGQRWLVDWGTPEQKARYLPGLISGSLIFSESISERTAASSLKALKSTARRDGGDWIINGEKIHINLGKESHVTLVYAMAEEGLTAFLVDTDLAGVRRAHSNPLGGRLLPTADMEFDNVRIPASAVLGEPGQGLATFLSTFNVSRLGNASELLGAAQRALSDATDYARERQVGTNRVTDFQGIQWLIADGYSQLYAASLVRDRAANLVAAGKEHAFEASLAKKVAIEAAEKVINDVFSLVGGHGLYHDQPYGQILFDIKTLRVGGGSLEVLRNYVSQQILRSDVLKGLK